MSFTSLKLFDSRLNVILSLFLIYCLSFGPIMGLIERVSCFHSEWFVYSMEVFYFPHLALAYAWKLYWKYFNFCMTLFGSERNKDNLHSAFKVYFEERFLGESCHL